MDYAVIMAGGSGTRLWPASRRGTPKQLLRLIGGRSLFQHAIDRLTTLFPAERTLVVARADLVPALSEHVPELPRENYIVEPEGRGTAPAIGLAAVHLAARDPEAVMAVLTADHHIVNADEFRCVLVAALAMAREGHLVTLGIMPTAPTTGYGYIEQGELVSDVGGRRAFRVARFTEKPNAEEAAGMVNSGRYAWNSGMFVWSVARIMGEFGRQTPQLRACLEGLGEGLSRGQEAYKAALDRLWPSAPRQAIDYAVMEHAEDAVVIPADIGWSDVGSWASVYELLSGDAEGNACVGPHLLLDTHRTLIYGDPSSGRLVTAIGVDDMIIVDTGDALLVCPRSREQDVRGLVARLGEAGYDAWL